MKVVYGWLQELLDGDLPAPDRVAEILTGVGLEVEEITRPGDAVADIVVAEVCEVADHPKADRLHVCQVSDGERTHTVVCGAPNVRPGMRVALARPGAHLPGGLRIETRPVRGVQSAGMLCSARELDLGDDHSGILDLSTELRIGAPLAQALGMDETVFTLGVTPNRPDALSHLGVARDLGAALGLDLRPPSFELVESGRPTRERTRVEIEAADGCRRYAARIIEGLTIGPSPLWMQARLRLCGVRPISNVVDVTNYVLLELGHPLHAFDLDRLREERIVVRWAREGERFSTLDGIERTLGARDLVIADAERPVALAGVMGGQDSEVEATTTRVLLESAHFEPTVIRRTSRRLGLSTEASYRFERGADPEIVPVAAARAAALFAELAGGTVAPGAVDVVARPYEAPRVRLPRKKVAAVLGVAIPHTRQVEILERLGFEILSSDEQATEVRAPSFRTEMGRAIDLVEEVARIEGYEALPSHLPPRESTDPPIEAADPTSPVMRALRRAALAADMSEVVNYSFVSPEVVRAVVGEGSRPDQSPIRVENPLTSEHSVMRTMVCQSLLLNLASNRRFSAERVRLFELGRAYLRGEDGIEEPERLALLLYGPASPRGWTSAGRSVDVFDLKGVLEAAARLLGVSVEARAAGRAHTHLHPRVSADLFLGDRVIGWMGEIHPRVADALNLPREVFLLEIDVRPLSAAARLVPVAQEPPRLPPVLRDLAVTVPAEVPAATLLALLHEPLPEAEAMGARVAEVRLFDVYEGEQVGAGRRSLAFALKFLADERTLEDREADALQAALLRRLEERVGAELRTG